MTTMADYTRLAEQSTAVLARVMRECVDCIAAHHELSRKRDAALAAFRNHDGALFSGVFNYRLEHFHSELLKKILDPATPETGDKQFLSVFMELLRNINPAVTPHHFSDAVKVERETEGIDILIHDETQAVIIENKINNARDMPNQLARYYQSVEGMGKAVAAVVYIPLFDGREPPFDGYEAAYKAFVPRIKEKLVVLPAVAGSHTGRDDLADGFLASCAGIAEAGSPRRYLVSQYAKLLKTMEGEAKMTEAIDREFIAEFYKDNKSIGTVETIAAVWNNRAKLLAGILHTPVREKLKTELGFYEEAGEKWRHSLFCDISDNLYIAFYSHPNENELHLGFWYEKALKGAARKSMEETLNAVLPEAYFKAVYDWGDPNDHWLTKQFCPANYKAPLAQIQAYFLDRCKALIEAAKELDL